MAARTSSPPSSPPSSPSSTGAPDPSTGRARAAALPAEERRAALVAATLPLLLAHGPAVTTRQIAEAAGVAEGTIFRVFPDKESLIEAVVESAFDMSAIDAALADIDAAQPLEARLVEAVDILRRRFAEILQLRAAVESLALADGRPAISARHLPPDLSGLAALFEPSRDQIRRDPLEAAHLLRGMTIAGTHPALILDEPLSSADIVSLFLDGVRTSDGAPTSDGGGAA